MMRFRSKKKKRNINHCASAFDERVNFWLQRSAHCLVRVSMLHNLRVRLACNHYAIAHAYNAAYANAQGSDQVC